MMELVCYMYYEYIIVMYMHSVSIGYVVYNIYGVSYVVVFAVFVSRPGLLSLLHLVRSQVEVPLHLSMFVAGMVVGKSSPTSLSLVATFFPMSLVRVTSQRTVRMQRSRLCTCMRLCVHWGTSPNVQCVCPIPSFSWWELLLLLEQLS